MSHFKEGHDNWAGEAGLLGKHACSISLHVSAGKSKHGVTDIQYAKLDLKLMPSPRLPSSARIMEPRLVS